MLDMCCLVLAGPRERLSWRFSLAPRRNQHRPDQVHSKKATCTETRVFIFERLSQNRCICWSSSESSCGYLPKKLPELSKGIGEGIRRVRPPYTTMNKRPRRASS